MKISLSCLSIRSSLLCTGLAALLSGGCNILPEASIDPSRYYVLNSPGGTEPSSPPQSRTYQIGLRPVELPSYLHQHRDMVVRTGANELRFQEFSLWAEPLESGLNRVLKERLQYLDTIGGVTTYPFSVDVRRDYDVVVRVLNCEGLMLGERKGAAHFVASYDIIASGAGGQIVVRRTFTAPDQPWNGSDFGALARLLSDDVAKLSEDIAANLPK